MQLVGSSPAVCSVRWNIKNRNRIGGQFQIENGNVFSVAKTSSGQRFALTEVWFFVGALGNSSDTTKSIPRSPLYCRKAFWMSAMRLARAAMRGSVSRIAMPETFA